MAGFEIAFTERELLVLRSLQEGKAVSVIADEMQISANTVCNHMGNIADKLKLHANIHRPKS